MVHVRMGQHDVGQGVGRHREVLPVAQAPPLLALKQPCVYQDAAFAELKEVFRPSHGPGGAEEGRDSADMVMLLRRGRGALPS